MPKYFVGQPVGDRALVRPFIEEGLSRASSSLLNWFVKYVNLLQRMVLLDTCMRKREANTHGGGWGDLCLGGDTQSNPGIVVDSMAVILVKRGVVITHNVIGHVTVSQVLSLTLSSGVFNEWGHILPVLIRMMITGSIRLWELKTEGIWLLRECSGGMPENQSLTTGCRASGTTLAWERGGWAGIGRR